MEQYTELFAKARAAQKLWQNKSFFERKTHTSKMLSCITEHADHFAELVSEETGKTRVDALTTEVLPCALALRWYSDHAEKVLAKKSLKTSSILFINKRSEIRRIPLGVVGIISPWNYPLAIPFGEVIMGLMAGNAIMLKVAANVKKVGELIREIVSKGDLPEGLFTLLEGPGSQVSEQLFANKIDKIFFTGSVAVGKELMIKSAEHLTPVSLELGGNDPMIVLEDADLERATNGTLWGGFQNAGQTCGGVERVYVHQKIYKPFIKLLAEKTKKLRHGVHPNHDVDIGGITTQKQLQTITEHVDEALQKGARILAQSVPVGDLSQGFFYPATVLVDVDHSMLVMREETFGPVIGIMPFKTEEEALQLANDSHLALTSSVWSKDLGRAKRLAQKIASGVTTINDHLYTHALSETPWGGWKESGIGRTHGAMGLEEMTHAKLINWDLCPTPRNMFWFPFSKETYDGIRSAMEFSFPTSPVSKMKGAQKLVPFALKRMLTKWEM